MRKTEIERLVTLRWTKPGVSGTIKWMLVADGKKIYEGEIDDPQWTRLPVLRAYLDREEANELRDAHQTKHGRPVDGGLSHAVSKKDDTEK